MDNTSIFENRRFFKRQTIEILKDGLKINKKTSFDSIEFEIPFEDIHNKKTVTSSVNHGTLVIAFFFLVVGTLYLLGDYFSIFFFCLFISVGIIISAFLLKKKVITINCYSGNKIELFYKNSDEKKVRDFADEIIKASNIYLLNKYSKVDKDLPFENQINNIEYLKNRDIISEEKFQELKNVLLGKESKSIGFNH